MELSSDLVKIGLELSSETISGCRKCYSSNDESLLVAYTKGTDEVDEVETLKIGPFRFEELCQDSLSSIAKLLSIHNVWKVDSRLEEQFVTGWTDQRRRTRSAARFCGGEWGRVGYAEH